MCSIRSLAPLLALYLLAAPVHASGLNLRWDRCFGDAGVLNKNFACDTNGGSETLVGSFVPASNIADVSAIQVELRLAFASVLPPWWQFQTAGTCRELSMSFDTVDPPSAVNCPDWANGQAASGISAYNIGARGPNTARIDLVVAVPPAALQTLTGGSEFFAFNITIDHAKTVGEGSCARCTTPGCVLFYSLTMVTPVPENNRSLTSTADPTDNDYVTWQGGAGVVVGGYAGCPNATPTRQRTWGAVKALYR